MNREKVLKISWYIFLAVMSILTVLFFFDIKFMVIGINILVWDVLTAGIWIFVRLCKWAGRENTGRRTVAVIAITLVGLFAAVSLTFILAMRGGLLGYIEGTELQTHRTFVVEYTQNMMGDGRAKLYERFGPLLLACDEDEYIGEFSVERPEDQKIYISKDGRSIVVAYFFLEPIFIIPLEQSVEAEKTPEQVLAEQLIDDTHDAFLVDTQGKLGTLLVTAELAMESKSEFGTRDITFTVWNPAEMEQPIQTFTEEFMMGVASEFHDVIDANFDGFQDFGYLFHAGNQPNYWHYWLWDEEQAQFMYYAPLIEVSQPVFDAEYQIVKGWARSSAASGTHSFYRWMDGELLLVREIYLDFIKMIVVKDLMDGQMVEVYHEEWEEKDEGDVLDVLDKWDSLDYHGESMEEN